MPGESDPPQCWGLKGKQASSVVILLSEASTCVNFVPRSVVCLRRVSCPWKAECLSLEMGLKSLGVDLHCQMEMCLRRQFLAKLDGWTRFPSDSTLEQLEEQAIRRIFIKNLYVLPKSLLILFFRRHYFRS